MELTELALQIGNKESEILPHVNRGNRSWSLNGSDSGIIPVKQH